MIERSTSTSLIARRPSFICVGLLCLCLALVLQTAAQSGSSGNFRDGDVNEDGQTDAADVLLVQQHLFDASLPLGLNLNRADVYPAQGDGTITISDLLLLQRGIAKHFPDDGISPSLAGTPSSSTSAAFTVLGTASPNVGLRIYLNGLLAGTTTADSGGAYSFPVTLASGANELQVSELNGPLDGATAGPMTIQLIAGSKVPKTGLDVSNVTGDDGDLQAGSPRQFVRDNVNEVVVDQLNGLTWEDTSDAKNLLVNRLGAGTHCTVLNTAQFAGITTWRLPGPFELPMLLDHRDNPLPDAPMIDPVFQNVAEYQSPGDRTEYWTNDIVFTNNGYRVFSVDFRNGGFAADPQTYTRRVRCVSGPEAFEPTIVDRQSVSETHKDVVNNLMWQDQPANDTSGLSWTQAVNYCEQLTANGFTDWRLPNVNEGYTLALHFFMEWANHDFVHGAPSPTLSNHVFWWTSTPHFRFYNWLQTLTLADTSGGTARARCVRTPIPPAFSIMPQTQAVGFGTNLQFSSGISGSFDGTISSYEWRDLSDFAILSTQESFAIDDLAVGEHPIRLTVVDSLGYYHNAEVVTITVEDNYAPEADAGPDQVVAFGDEVFFDGTASFARQGTLDSYEWKEGQVILSNLSSFSTSSLTLGVHTIQLTVTDSQNENDSDTLVVTVLNPPQAEAGPASVTVEEGQTVTFDASNSTTPNGSIVAWAWYEGGVLLSDQESFSKSDFSVGTHTVELTVTDSEGLTASDTIVVEIEEPFSPYPLEVCPVVPVTDDGGYVEQYPVGAIDWIGANYTDVNEIELAFNHARFIDDSVDQYLDLPTQAVWDTWTPAKQGLYLINAERQARGIKPYTGIAPEITSVIQQYTGYILSNNLPGGHYHDGSPQSRLDDYGMGVILNHRDAFVLTESLATIIDEQTAPVDTDSIVHAIYGWLYRDVPPYNPTGYWGHRDQILQRGLKENTGDAHTEGLIGIGISSGPYLPSGSQGPQGSVTGINVVDPAETWDFSNVITVDTDTAQLCNTNTVIVIDEADVPNLSQLIGLQVSPSDALLVEGGATAFEVIGVYDDDTTADLTAFAQFQPDSRSVVSVDSGSINGLVTGYTFVSARVGSLHSNRALVNVEADNLSTSNLQGTFGQAYTSQIPSNASLSSYDPKAFTLFTGLVKDHTGSPMPGVSVVVQGAPEYGSAPTDANGRFVLPVESGLRTLVYRKTGYLTVHRSQYGASSAWANMDDVALLPVDSVKTTIDLTASAPQVHTSSPISDARGVRQATVVFDGVTTATVTSVDGSQQTLTEFAMRATEYELPDSMPAELPNESAFTYCTELEVVGLRDDDTVVFDQPVVTYIDNFLDFAVGEVVPVGYYNRNIATWVADPNGVVVKLLDTDQNGQVDSLDYDGDDQPDDLNNNGDTTDEVRGIEGFTPGDTYWRRSSTHFSAVDLNWPEDLPSDAEEPDTPDTETSEEDPLSDEHACVNSYVTPFERGFHEDIPIIGTELTLHYSSQRTQGYHHRISVPVTDAAGPPASVQSMVARVDIAGKRFEQLLLPGPNKTAEFFWDGRDELGHRPSGSVQGKVSIGFTYATQYASVGNAATSQQPLSSFPVAWATAGSSPTAILGRRQFTSWNSHDIYIQNSHQNQLANGWSISNYHEKVRPDLIYKGDGTSEEIHSGSLVLKTGIQASQVDFDDGYYQKGGSAIDYAISSDGVLKDTVTGLEWEYTTSPARFVDKVDAEDYCENDVLPADSGWRLPTPKEMVYSIDKADGTGHYFPIYRFDALTYWNASTVNPEEREISVVCVRGDSIDTTYVTGLQRNNTLEVVTDSNNALMWQDDASTASSADTKTWTESIAQCEASDHAGYEDWRLPNINELAYTLPNAVFMHQTELTSGPWTPTAPFRKPYWSSTPNAQDGDEETAWAMESESYSHWSFDKNDQYNVRCVRDDTTALASPYRFDNQGKLTKTIDIDTGIDITVYDHDAAGQLQSIADQFGNTLTLNRDVPGEISLITQDNYVTKLIIDGATNELTRVEYPDTTFYEFGYTTGSLLNYEKDPRGSEFTHLFDSHGRTTQTDDPEGGQWLFTRQLASDGSALYGYDTVEGSNYSTTRTTLPDGSVQKTTTFKDGRVSINTYLEQASGDLETTQSCDVTTQVQYVKDAKTRQDIPGTVTVTTPNATGNPVNLVSTTVVEKVYAESGSDLSGYTITTTHNSQNPGTVEFESYFDAATHRSTATSPEGRMSITDYDADSGLLKKVTPPGGFLPTSYTYDSRGRVKTVTTGTRTLTYEYDAAAKGDVSDLIADDGKTTQYSYDALGRIDVVTHPDLTETDTDHDANGNIEEVTIPTVADYGFTYSQVNERDSSTTPLNETTTFVYDRDRRLKEMIYPSSPTYKTLHTYANGKLDYSDTPEGRIDYSYGTCGDRVAGVEELWSGESVDYVYDGNLLRDVTYEGALDETIAHTYNNELLLDSLTYAGSSTGTITYDDDGVLTHINGLTITPKVGSPLPQAVVGGAYAHLRSYNSYGEINIAGTAINGQSAYGYSLTYNDLGQIRYKTETLHDGTQYNYEYIYHPDRRWLTQVKRDNGAGGSLQVIENYSYDDNGNRSVVGATSTYNAADQLENNGAGTTYTYNPEGFLETKTTGGVVTTYDYSSDGRLRSVTTPSQTVSYQHNAIGNPVTRLVDGVEQAKYLWLDKTTLLATFEPNGNVKQRFEYGIGHTPTQFTQSGQTYYIAVDHLGSPRAITDASGTVLRAYDYDSFGQRTTLVNTGGDVEIPFGFAGGFYDEATGLVRFGYRDYDPAIGRWTARDPIGLAGGQNLYGYAFQVPIRYTDKYGLGPELPAITPAQVALQAATFSQRTAGPLVSEVGGPKSSTYDPGRDGHIFSDSKGHVNPPTDRGKEIVRDIFERVGGNPDYLRNDAVDAKLLPQDAADAGVQAYTLTLSNGEQIWVFVRDGIITDAGLNLPGHCR